MIDLLLAKVQITEGYNRSTNQSQQHLVDTLFKQSMESTGFFVKDTWIQISDYERSQQLAKDTMQYLLNSRTLLQNISKENYQLPLLQYQLAMKLREEQMQVHHVLHEKETKNVKQSSELILESARKHLATYREETDKKLVHLEQSIIDLSRECQKVREELLQQQMVNDDKVKVLWAFIHTLQTALQQLSAKMEIVIEERDRVVIESKLMADNTRHQLRVERKHCANLLFMIHSQRGMIQYLKEVIKKVNREAKQLAKQQKFEKYQLRKELWETVFTFTRLCTDVDLLFEFFATRIANLSGSRAALNDQLAYHNAALVLAALCKNPKPIIRRSAARALGNMGWNGFVETRILLWDCIMYWKMVKSKVITRDTKDFHETLEKFNETGQYDAVINLKSEIEEFVPTGNLSLRSIIKQRRQWALRAARRLEGPNVSNQKLLNIRDGVLISLLQLCVDSEPALPSADANEKEINLSTAISTDWEIARNAALAISIASYEPTNHKEMVHHPLVLKMIMQMCNLNDAEIQTHAAVTIANLSYKDEEAQRIFGQQTVDQVGTNKVEGYRTHSGGVIPKLLDMLTGPIADVLEASTAALANLTCYCDANCETVFKYDGLPKIMKVITQSYSENLLDLDQNDEVHANASEILANISRFSTKESIKYFTSEVIDNLVIMCASPNKQLRRHISLVLGNIGQSERCREDIGMKGGIEALFLTLEDTDTIVQANALWALSNLMWHPPNQERAGRFIKEIIILLQSPYEPVMVNACILLGNVLYYNTPNRVRFLDVDGAFELLISYIRSHYPPDQSKFQYPVSVLEACLRSMLSLSYLDSIAMWLGEEGKCIPVFIHFLYSPFISREVMRYSLEIICNLCLHHANRRIIYEEKGIDAIVPLHSDSDAYVRDLSVQVIEHLEDITPAEVLARARSIVGLERMVTLASNDDPLVRAVAAEAIGEEIWMDPSKQSRAHEIGAIDSLLGIINNPDERLESLLPALWSLRNLLHNHSAAQAQFGYRDGIKAVAQVIRRGLTGTFHEQAEKVFEACIACLISAVTKEPRNARRLVMVGLDAVIEISEESSLLKKQTTILFAHGQSPLPVPPAIQQVIVGIKNEGVQALVNSLLLLLAPYNYVVCKNCGRKQDLHGTSCYFCGHRLLVDVDVDRISGAAASNTDPSKVNIRQSQSANSFNPPPWRHAGKAMDTALTADQEDPNYIKGNFPVKTIVSPQRAMSKHGSIGGALGGIGTGMISSNYASTEEKKSYFSRTLPTKLSASASQLPTGDGGNSHPRPLSATGKK
jgi:HEAT repeat protein